MNINLERQKGAISYLGKKLFNELVSLPQSIRRDKKPRSGIQVFARIVGTGMFVNVTIKRPTKEVRFGVMAISLRAGDNAHRVSQDSDDVERLRCATCISIFLGDEELSLAVGGLKPEENFALELIIISRITGISVDEVLHEIHNDGGVLPSQLFKEGYLKNLLSKYQA